MNLFAPQHLIPILIILLLLFGRGKISDFMGDFAKGIKSFKKGLKDDEDDIVQNTPSPSVPEAIEMNRQQNPAQPHQAAAGKAESEISAHPSANSKS